MKPARIVRGSDRAAVVDGTSIKTRGIYTLHLNGYEYHHIMGEYPTLTYFDIEAAIAYEQRPIRRLQRALAPVIEWWSERLADVAWGWR